MHDRNLAFPGRARLSALVAALLLTVAAAAAAPPVTASADDAYLDRLLGRWDIAGSVLGKSVRYRAAGERVLDGGFLRLHMVDAAPTPTYVADVFIGYDPKRQDFVAHWLDRFGAHGARVVATGTRDGERLVLVFPYQEAAFRDTFSWDEAHRTWHLLLESQQAGGEWSTFADFMLRRPGHGRAAAGAPPR